MAWQISRSVITNSVCVISVVVLVRSNPLNKRV
ncbi:Uncharacterised protein [Vibrio cholerae]|nr:Uncharacterised protein [Vibrio cholerae]